jgi:DNA-binding MarR family transcriptional regulator
MNSTSVEITIPGAIAALALPIGEKVVLAHISKNPTCGNASLAKLTGITERGLKKLLQRLRSAGHVEQVGKRRARRIFLTFHVEQGTECLVPEKEICASNGELCSSPPSLVATKIIPLEDDFEQTMQLIDEMTRERHLCPATLVWLLRRIIERLETELSAGEMQENILHELYVRQGAFMALSLAVGMPRKFLRDLDRRICAAMPEQLMAFRQGVLASQLEDRSPLLLAALSEDRGVSAS